jgi:hypothetical protein
MQMGDPVVRSSRLIGTILFGILITATTEISAEPETPQALDDAWWTGPLVAYSPHSLPQGHLLIEPYLFDVSGGRADSVHSFTYFLYGATDRLTVGFAPDLVFNSLRGGTDGSGVHLGDTTLRAQYMLVAMDAAKDVPDLALAVLQNLPSGKYDRLGRAGDGIGGGAYATTLALYSQMVWWMPNGRLLRTRLNLSESFSPRVPVSGASVYSTDTGFLGHAQPGNQFSAVTAFEYSATRNWVLAIDLIYNHGDTTSVQGFQGTNAVYSISGTSDAFGFAPALEYNWASNIGALIGVRVLTAGHNSKATVTPAIALNYVL